MKRTIVVGVLLTAMAQAQAYDLGRVLLGAGVLGAVYIAYQQSVPQTPPQPVAPPPPPEPEVIYVVRPSAPRPTESPRSQYLRDCQGYGISLERCTRIWDGPDNQ
jgi:hypothetical protein